MNQVLNQNTEMPDSQDSINDRKIIMIIEDDPFLLQMYSDKFMNDGFGVVVARDGMEGLKVLGEKHVDIILLDILIPKLSGVDLLGKIKEDPKLQNIPVIALTNLTNAKEEDDVKAKGVKEYLIKSDYTPTQVIEIVRKYL
jgi:two-component system alkaline phosphatase synthesis response regulator PhoP